MEYFRDDVQREREVGGEGGRERERERETDRQTDREVERDRERDRHTDREADRQAGRQRWAKVELLFTLSPKSMLTKCSDNPLLGLDILFLLQKAKLPNGNVNGTSKRCILNLDDGTASPLENG